MRTVLRVKVVGAGGVVAQREFRVDSLAHGPVLARSKIVDHDSPAQFTNARPR